MNAQVPNIELRVSQYVELRDKIKKLEEEHKAKMKPYRDTLEQLNGALLGHLHSISAESAKTGAGTVYLTAKKSASVGDMTAFWSYCVATGNFDLVDKRANVTAVADFVEQNKQLPPGVNFNVTHIVGVRRA